MSKLLIVSFLYLFTGLLYIYDNYRYIKRTYNITILSCAKLMYAFVYGFFPSYVLFRNYLGVSNINIAIAKDSSLISFFFLIASVLGYFFLSVGYKLGNKKNRQSVVIENIKLSTVYIYGWISILIGYLSIYLWTRAYGSIWNFILDADAVRASYSIIYNPLAFLEHFARIILFSSYVIVPYFFSTRNSKHHNIWFIPMILSILGTILFMLLTDSRGTIAFFIIIIYFVYNDINKARISTINMKNFIRNSILVFIIVFVLIIFSEYLMYFVRFKTWPSSFSLSFFDILEREFGFIILTQFKLSESLFNSNFRLLLFNDIINSVFAWIPNRFIWFDLPPTLWAYNSELLNSSGTAPCDLISASLYSIGFFGIFVYPLVLGLLFRRIDVWKEKKGNDAIASATYYSIAMLTFNIISHFQWYYIVLYSFHIFLSISIVFLVKLTSRK